MKQLYPQGSIVALCRLFGKTRHAYYDHQWRKQEVFLKDDIVLQLVRSIRESLPRIGTRKLHYMLTPRLAEHHITIGRDYLFDLLDEYKLLIRKRKRKAVTTDSRHWLKKYKNLIRELHVTYPEQLWVCDITYVRIINCFAYLFLITDAYSRKIMGYCFRKDLSAEGCVIALRMALANRSYPNQDLIHHSDRGSQYCCHEYVGLLQTNRIAISMTENSDPYENAIAERINGTIKIEFNLNGQYGFEQTNDLINQSIQAYNQLRPHASCNYLTPHQAHQQTGPLKRRWKNYYQQKQSLTNPEIFNLKNE